MRYIRARCCNSRPRVSEFRSHIQYIHVYILFFFSSNYTRPEDTRFSFNFSRTRARRFSRFLFEYTAIVDCIRFMNYINLCFSTSYIIGTLVGTYMSVRTRIIITAIYVFNTLLHKLLFVHRRKNKSRQY